MVENLHGGNQPNHLQELLTKSVHITDEDMELIDEFLEY